MGSPYHTSRCAPYLSRDEASLEVQAISLIAESLAHPHRALLSAFIQQAVDRELAARFFLDDTVGSDKATVADFLADWISLPRRIRPIVCEELEPSLRRSIWRRDGGRCCISKADGRWKYDKNLLPIYVVSPTLFQDGDMVRDGRLCNMLAMFIGRSKLECLRSLLSQDSDMSGCDSSDQLVLLSSQMFAHFANGRLSLKVDPLGAQSNSVRYFVKTNSFMPSIRVDVLPFIRLENRATDTSSLPNPQLIEVHHQFALALAWLEVFEYMRQRPSSPCSSTAQDRASLPRKVLVKESWIRRCTQLVSPILQHLWLQTPVSLRAIAYNCLASLGQQFYGDTGSDRIHRLPFNLYLRKAHQDWAPRHQAELRSLQIVQAYTRIPAPKGIDTIQYRESSYLLMTGLHGHGIGQRLSTMTDGQLDAAAQDLKDYLTELRRIPNNTGSRFSICNSLGGGILDWRIGDSQRKQLRFHDETEFNQFLTTDLPLDEDAWIQISKSHGVKHDIVFTHADLNLRNILVDEMGRISGIVDWECAGWYPEYWEYSKMHFTVRHTPRWITDVVDQIFPAYRDELNVENMLSGMMPSW
ncbi:phosphotransferase enzyme family-domain-containing protein [Alternaria rosae]|uniref:phosphotransferase enzyme family-domain-containing protein n=1 Tax=Alternaria rosae TaxID=1187941 RepID=UPI001E8CE960|nr:phosphotransferase enzyme family-domain-containing protein [Alternaria rosae]KAH6875990.1 phosphotransferase enzyme family-domain-containing protein [Alternaria rosae]